MEINISNDALTTAAQKGGEAFLLAVADAVWQRVGKPLTAEGMQQLNASQITLLGYTMLRDEVMCGGFIQLIYNGYGPFFFLNPFDKAMEVWGLSELYSMLRKVHKLYSKYHKDIEAVETDDEFMALYEQYPQFDEFDDEFVEHEANYTLAAAHYLDEHLSDFVNVTEHE